MQRNRNDDLNRTISISKIVEASMVAAENDVETQLMLHLCIWSQRCPVHFTALLNVAMSMC